MSWPIFEAEIEKSAMLPPKIEKGWICCPVIDWMSMAGQTDVPALPAGVNLAASAMPRPRPAAYRPFSTD